MVTATRARTGKNPAHPQRSRAPPAGRVATRGHGFAPRVHRRSARSVEVTSSLDRGDAGLLDLAPDAHLAVIGRGPFEHELRRLVARLQVEHAVTFTSFDATQREALGALVRSCDVVALMSDYEAHPVAVMEAVALERKVV